MKGTDDMVARRDVVHSIAHRLDDTGDLMPKDHGRRHHPHHVQVGVTDATGRNLDKNLTLLGAVYVDLLYLDRLIESREDRRAHRAPPTWLPHCWWRAI
jgi:hypothetical protein